MRMHTHTHTHTHTQPETHLGEVAAEEDQVFLMAQQVSQYSKPYMMLSELQRHIVHRTLQRAPLFSSVHCSLPAGSSCEEP